MVRFCIKCITGWGQMSFYITPQSWRVWTKCRCNCITAVSRTKSFKKTWRALLLNVFNPAVTNLFQCFLLLLSCLCKKRLNKHPSVGCSHQASPPWTPPPSPLSRIHIKRDGRREQRLLHRDTTCRITREPPEQQPSSSSSSIRAAGKTSCTPGLLLCLL